MVAMKWDAQVRQKTKRYIQVKVKQRQYYGLLLNVAQTDNNIIDRLLIYLNESNGHFHVNAK